MPYLVVRDRSGKVLWESELTDPLRVGRSPSCAIRLRDPQVSREHCEIAPRGEDCWMVRDLNSHNGTTVNGKVAAGQVLHDGDRIELGKHRLTFTAAKPEVRVRPRDPVAAGLIDCESRIGSAIQEWTPAASSGESSLFATRVTAALDDPPTVTADQSPVPHARSSHHRWRLWLSAAAAMTLATLAWLRWG